MNINNYKLIILGETSVGKTSLSIRFFSSEFYEEINSTVGAIFQIKTIKLGDGRSIRFEIWDTAGQERYRSVSSIYYRGASIAMVVYDITSMSSFEKSKYWMNQLQDYQGIDIVLVGNKVDLKDKRTVPETTAKQYANSMNVIYFETSAKTGENIDKMFDEFIKIAEKKSSEKPISYPIEECTNKFDQQSCTNKFDQQSCTNKFDQQSCTNKFDQRSCTNKQRKTCSCKVV